MGATNLQNHKKRLITLCTWKTGDVDTKIIYNQDIGIEFSREKCPILIMKSGRRETIDGIEPLNQESIKKFGEKKITSIWVYWNLKPSTKRWWKKKNN